jgi:IS5 family transposase
VEGFQTGGEVHDVAVASELTEDVYGCKVLEDRGYDSDKHRQDLISNNNIPVIPGRKLRKKPIIYDKKLYKLESKIEMLFGKIKENRST